METHTLNRTNVRRLVSKNAIGCYRLGDFDSEGRFVADYIGRSTRNLRNRLLDHASLSGKSAFQFVSLDSVREVFDTECLWFHLLRDQLTNRRHPDAPRHRVELECRFCKAEHSVQQGQLRAMAEHQGVV